MSCWLYDRSMLSGPIRPVNGVHGVPVTKIIDFDMSAVPMAQTSPRRSSARGAREAPTTRANYTNAARTWASQH